MNLKSKLCLNLVEKTYRFFQKYKSLSFSPGRRLLGVQFIMNLKSKLCLKLVEKNIYVLSKIQISVIFPWSPFVRCLVYNEPEVKIMLEACEENI